MDEASKKAAGGFVQFKQDGHLYRFGPVDIPLPEAYGKRWWRLAMGVADRLERIAGRVFGREVARRWYERFVPRGWRPAAIHSATISVRLTPDADDPGTVIYCETFDAAAERPPLTWANGETWTLVGGNGQ